MPLLYLEPLPPRTTKGEILALLIQQGAIDRQRVGRIDLQGGRAVIEVPDAWAQRLAASLDGAALKERRLRAWTVAARSTLSGEDHFARLARLLEIEAKAEAKRALERAQRLLPAEAERSGNSLVDLVIADEASGLGGRCILTLTKRRREQPLPWNRLGVGTPILLSVGGAPPGQGMRGVVCERHERHLAIAVNEAPEDTDSSTGLRVDLADDETARQRLRIALERARSAQRDRLAELRGILLGEKPPTFGPPPDFAALDPALNESQQEAVRFALTANDVAIIHGPPGTGKTTTVVELIRQAVRRGEKVLACAPSNLAVDNMLERLLAFGEHAVRLGHPARVLPALRERTLDLMVEDHTDVRLARKLVKEAFALFRKAKKFTRAKPEPGARREQRQEAKQLLADARRLEFQAAEQILRSATVVCATATGLDSEILGQHAFGLAVIDEACQSTEPGCWVPLSRCQRVVLAGDHQQLPPTVLSRAAADEGFAVSMLERLVALHGASVTRRLDVQYRMHEAIMRFSSQEFYEDSLQADASVQGHLLCDLPGVTATELTQTPIHFIDTAGAGYDEQLDPDGESRLNPDEAALVVRKVQDLLAAGLAPEQIAVIAPYSGQVRWLRDRLRIAGLEIDTVDGFQGREKEAVVLSMVRSNAEGEIGFLADVRRMNVALTRARRKLLVIGDSATLAVHPFYQNLLSYFEALAAYHTVWEEPAEG